MMPLLCGYIGREKVTKRKIENEQPFNQNQWQASGQS
jgi:hypothetical protein